MKRREFITKATLGGLVAGGVMQRAAAAESKPVIKWKMITTWPKNFPGLGTGANNVAHLINEMSGGRIEVKVYGDKELVPALEVFDTVSKGDAQMGHGAAYYWKGKNEAFQFFSAVPFGFTAQEMIGWLYLLRSYPAAKRPKAFASFRFCCVRFTSAPMSSTNDAAS